MSRKASIKRGLSALLAAIMLLLPIVSLAAYQPGDTDNDGKINAFDIGNVQKHMLGLGDLTGDAFAAADTNADGKVNALDVGSIQSHMLGIKPLPTLPPSGGFTITEVVAAASQLSGSSRAYVNPDHPDAPGTEANGGDKDEPASITVGAVQVERPAYFILMARAIVAINSGNKNVTLVHNDYASPTLFAVNDIQPKHATQGMMAAAAQRNIAYAEENGRVAAQAPFPDVYPGNPDGYSGQFNYLCATYIFSQALQYYGVNGTLPWLAMPTLPQQPGDTPPPILTPTPQPATPPPIDGTFTVAQVAGAASQLTGSSRAKVTGGTAANGGDKDEPEFITISSKSIPRPAYFILMARAITAINAGNTTSAFKADHYAIPSQYANNSIQPKHATQGMMAAAAQRNISYAETNGRLPAQVLFPDAYPGNPEGYSGQFNYLYATYIFAQALQYYSVNGKLPWLAMPTLPQGPDDTPPPFPTPTPEPTTPPPINDMFTVTDVAAAASQLSISSRAKVANGTAANGGDKDDPEVITVGTSLGGTVALPRTAYFILMARAIDAIYKGDTTPVFATKIYDIPTVFAVNNIQPKVAIPEMIVAAARRNIAFAELNNRLPAQVPFPDFALPDNPGGYSGQFNYLYATYIFSQALQYYRVNGKLPSLAMPTLPQGPNGTTPPLPTPTPTLPPISASFMVQQIAEAASQITKQSRAKVANGTAVNGMDRDEPASIGIDDTTLLRPAYFILMCRAIVAINAGNTSSAIEAKNYYMPNSWANNDLNPKDVTPAVLVFAAQEYIKTTETTSIVLSQAYFDTANPENPEGYSGQLNYLYANYVFAQALQYYAANSSLPATLEIPTLTFS